MSIKAIALELYKAQQKVSSLEKKIEAAPLSEQNDLKEELRLAQSELRQYRSILNGEKSPSPYSSKPSTFKR